MQLSEARHAFITGGASGIGLAIADVLAARGIAVTIADINEDSLVQVVARRGNQFRGVLLDTRDRESWGRVKAEAEAVFGPVDLLFNNAGIAPNGSPFAEMDPGSFDRIVAINLTGVFNGVSAFAADMRERRSGHIVNTSSQAGLVTTVPGVGAYSVAKFGVTALSEALRRELAPDGVGVTCLCPGYVQTNLADNTRRVGGEVRAYSEMPPSTVSTTDVGEMVAKAIEENAAYVITHTDVWPGLEARMNGLREACEAREAAAP